MDESTKEGRFLDHPEIVELMSSVLATLVDESDRGAVLVGFTHVDNHLKKLFDAFAPSDIGRKRRYELFNYPGALSTASAKADIALMTRLIPRTLHTAITHFRKIRNDVAHSPDSFRLIDHERSLRGMFDLGPGMPLAINRWALEAIMTNVMDALLGPGAPTDDKGVPYFSTPHEAIEHLSNRPGLRSMLDDRRRRLELAIAVVLICALIVFHRDKARALVANHETLSGLSTTMTLPPTVPSPPTPAGDDGPATLG